MKKLPKKYGVILTIWLVGAFTVPVFAQETAPQSPRRQANDRQQERGPRQRPVVETEAATLATGPLTQEEIQVLRQMIQDYQQRLERRNSRRGAQNVGSDPENRSARRQEMLERFDRDGDGVLSAEERRIAVETMQAERRQRREQSSE